MADRECAVYRLYDSAEGLLYVGATVDPAARFDVHSREKQWWPDVARTDLQWFSSRDGAGAAEREAISSECPRHNAIHAGRAKTPTSSAHQYGGQHTYRVHDHVWAEATARAKRQNKRDRVSQVVREFLDWYTDQPGAKMPRRPTEGDS